MILGSSRRWWIAAGLIFVVGIALLATGTGGALGGAAGVALIILAMILFAASPMRYGDRAKKAPPAPPDTAPPAAPVPPRPRPEIAGRDANEV